MSTPLTFDTATAVERIGGPSEEWLITKLRSGAFPGRKIGRHWRLTEVDIQEILEICSNRTRRPASKPVQLSSGTAAGLTRTSRKRLAAL